MKKGFSEIFEEKQMFVIGYSGRLLNLAAYTATYVMYYLKLRKILKHVGNYIVLKLGNSVAMFNSIAVSRMMVIL